MPLTDEQDLRLFRALIRAYLIGRGDGINGRPLDNRYSDIDGIRAIIWEILNGDKNGRFNPTRN